MKRLFLLATMVLGAMAANAQDWADITNQFVTNPNFNTSTEGWVVAYDGSTAQNYGYQSSSYSNYDIDEYVYISSFAEAWRENNGGGWWGWDEGRSLGDGSIHQTLAGVPAGTFRLEADVIAVDQSGRNNPVSGFFLFIADTQGEGTTEVATNNNKPQHFSVEYTTTTNEIVIGIRTEGCNGNWLAIDNVKLYWQGQEVKATGLSVTPKTKTISVGESFTITPTIYPANTTFKTVEWTTSDKSVAQVDANGVVTGYGSGTATIRCRLTGGSNNLASTCMVTVERIAATDKEVVVNEIQAANVDMFMDPSFNYGGWIELYNPTDKGVSLGGCYLSDDPQNLQKAQIGLFAGALPAHGYLTLWLDHYSRWAPTMIDFKLDCDGGTIYIADPDGNLITSCSYPPAISRTSYARTTDGGNQWNYTDQPTPGATNNTSTFSANRLAPPAIDHDGGMIESGLTAHVTIPQGTTLRYTTDGSTPTLINGETSTDGQFDIEMTTVLRLRLFQEGKLSSPVVTRSFIMRDRDYTLPVVSIVTADEHINGQDYGIFARGNGNGRPGNGQSTSCNWNMDWERPVNFEYFTADGQPAVNLEMGMEAAGGWSRAWAPHSSNLKTNKRYEGVNKIDYPFFADRPYTRQKSLKLRNGGNDYNNGRIKDAAIQQVVRTSGLYVETQGWNPVHEFINGQYIGLLNMREPNNKHYGYSVYGIDTDNMDQWKMSPDSGYVQQEGTRDAWEELLQLSKKASNAENYERIKQLLDIEEYINYLAVELYIGGTDWPQNNVKAFRDRNGGRFRFVLFDTDGALATTSPFTAFAGKQNYTFDLLYGVDDLYPSRRITKEIEFVTLFLNLLRNAEFKKQFIDQFCIVAGSVFDPEHVKSTINQMISHVSAGQALEGRSPNSAYDVMNALNSSRQSTLVSSMRSYLALQTSQKVALSSDTPEARLLINDLPVPTGRFNGQLFSPVTVKALAPAGKKFIGWYGQSSSTGNTLFESGSSWTYYDQGSLDGDDWTASNYDDSFWREGYAPLGYYTSDPSNGRGYKTELEYGLDANYKYPTYYFRKKVNVSKAKSTDNYTLNWVADDGFVIYVNGTEAGRYYMNNTPRPTFYDYADSFAPGNPESGTMTLDASLFREGMNTIAVEVHNNQGNSTDIYWDASLARGTEELGNLVSTEAEYKLPTSGTVTLVAAYEPLSDEEMAQSDARPVKINEVSAANDTYINDYQKKADWIELYNTTDQPIDIAGMYISDNLSKPEKVQIPANSNGAQTVIPAHGFIIIWADKQASKQQLHVDFKLDADSGCVVITAEDKSWADTLFYSPHAMQQTVGLYPDGGNMVYVMEQPTIGTTNQLSMYAAIWDEPVYDDGTVGIKQTDSDGGEQDNIIFDMAGRKVGTLKNSRQLPKGIYIINGRKVLK